MTVQDFRPTHVIPQGGLPSFEMPDVSRTSAPLDPLLPVQLLDRRGDWGQVLCANGWSTWVDARLLVSVPRDPPPPGLPLARTADPRPLLARVEETLRQYRGAVLDLAEGRTDGEGFRGRTRGLRVGAVVDGESVWLYDAEHERWVYGDGAALTAFAASEPPAAAEPEAPGAGAPGPGPEAPGPGPEAAGPGPEAPGPGPETRPSGPDARAPEAPAPAAPGEKSGTPARSPEGHEPTRVVSRDGRPDGGGSE
ncbi:hypothetical protein QCN29_15635 [Streptomyces sp. HNM0663]|uniref:Uncharacterized protein n=1 Tax=Streptomyces chengmaiensis TaxID=3040919 RepID=A0ABT6HPD9_9ACTN|nr:hypothetical protein [Streptomyces chengmaiensis]MDH2390196.1 hypothetical protein [Streptomyces chengmaiensis]